MSELFDQLAASQAREAKLREALKEADAWLKGGMYVAATKERIAEALALPADDTALREYGAKLLEKGLMMCSDEEKRRNQAVTMAYAYITFGQLAAALRAGKVAL